VPESGDQLEKYAATVSRATRYTAIGSAEYIASWIEQNPVRTLPIGSGETIQVVESPPARIRAKFEHGAAAKSAARY